MNILIDTAIFHLQSQGGVSRLWRSLIPALADTMPDATFDPSLPPDWFISTYYKRAPLGVKSLVMVYDLIAQRYPLIDSNRDDMIDLRGAVQNASAIVSISQTTAHDVQQTFGKASTVAYPGVDAEFGKVKPSDVDRFRAYIGKPYILVVGRRGLYKNVQALYQAWGLWPDHNNYRLLCVGGEEMLPQDAAFDSRYGDTRLRMVLDDHDLPLAYAGAAALVYPSLMEGFGLPLVEAMACACPVICDPAMREVTGGCALYADTTRPRAIADALSAPMDLEKVITGVERAKQFTWGGMAAKIAEALRAA